VRLCVRAASLRAVARECYDKQIRAEARAAQLEREGTLQKQEIARLRLALSYHHLEDLKERAALAFEQAISGNSKHGAKKSMAGAVPSRPPHGHVSH
jgi:hypothetical protein